VHQLHAKASLATGKGHMSYVITKNILSTPSNLMAGKRNCVQYRHLVF
jgi:hypothetical protein